ncbi:hypothetical protein [Cupriavidus pauculus]|uniref:hypothetical protein n=1 Tax=Cupriavidus pauculus TaxID=82633 RepID=UPI000A451C58|nr:hypothetical protein [Cupriavidus pauculus]
MAIKVKNATLQIRLTDELLGRFQAVCEARETSVSEYVRRWIVGQVQDHERREEKARMDRARHAPPSQAPVPAPAPPQASRDPMPLGDIYVDDPVTVSNREVGGLKRKERRELEKQARKARGGRK